MFQQGTFMFSIGNDSSVAKSSFRMTKTYCHSDRKAFFALTRNLYVSARNLYTFVRKDSSVAKSSFRMTKTYCHFEREAVFLRLGIFLSFRQKSCFCFDEESFSFSKEALCFRKRKDSSVAKSSFRMTKTYCHSDRKSVV